MVLELNFTPLTLPWSYLYVPLLPFFPASRAQLHPETFIDQLRDLVKRFPPVYDAHRNAVRPWVDAPSFGHRVLKHGSDFCSLCTLS